MTGRTGVIEIVGRFNLKRKFQGGGDGRLMDSLRSGPEWSSAFGRCHSFVQASKLNAISESIDNHFHLKYLISFCFAFVVAVFFYCSAFPSVVPSIMFFFASINQIRLFRTKPTSWEANEQRQQQRETSKGNPYARQQVDRLAIDDINNDNQQQWRIPTTLNFNVNTRIWARIALLLFAFAIAWNVR